MHLKELYVKQEIPGRERKFGYEKSDRVFPVYCPVYHTKSILKFSDFFVS